MSKKSVQGAAVKGYTEGKPLIVAALLALCLIIAACASNEFEADFDSIVEEELVVSGVRASGMPDREATALQRIAGANTVADAPIKQKTWRPASAQANAARLQIGHQQYLKPEWSDIQVQIDGFRARVVLDGFYHNPHGRMLEGDFKFRLPDGAKPYYFAFGEALKYDRNLLQKAKHLPDPFRPGYLSPQALTQNRESHWKEPKHAIMVTREKAAFAYEDTVARQIDPALMEWAGAGIFSAKVFPLMPDAINRVVIGYDISLQAHQDALYLDLALGKQLAKRVHISFSGSHRKAVQIHRVLDEQLQEAQAPKVKGGVLQYMA